MICVCVGCICRGFAVLLFGGGGVLFDVVLDRCMSAKLYLHIVEITDTYSECFIVRIPCLYMFIICMTPQVPTFGPRSCI